MNGWRGKNQNFEEMTDQDDGEMVSDLLVAAKFAALRFQEPEQVKLQDPNEILLSDDESELCTGKEDAKIETSSVASSSDSSSEEEVEKLTLEKKEIEEGEGGEVLVYSSH